MPTDIHIDAVVETSKIEAQVISDGIPFPGPEGPQGEQGEKGDKGDPGNDGVVQLLASGDGISIDNTDPANPVVSIPQETLVLSKTIHITSNDILNMVANPIPLIDAPGTGFFILPLSAVFSFHFGTIAYTVNAGQFDMMLNYGTQGGGNTVTWSFATFPFLNKNILHFSVDGLGLFSEVLSGQASGINFTSDLDDQPLTLTQKTNANTEYTGGDGEADLTILYRIVPII